MVFETRSKFKLALKEPPIFLKIKSKTISFFKKNCTTLGYDMACPCIGFAL
jgi:hypothetical protein